jgi:hypothetical protein
LWELSIPDNSGVLEYWSVGVMAKALLSFLNTPIRHHSIPPEARASNIFSDFKFVGLSPVD